MKCDIQVRQLGTRIAYRYSRREGRLHQAATNRKQNYTGEDNNADLYTWILLPTYIISGESKAGDTLSSRHVSSCDVTRAVGM
jgi:hypothetical protein